MGIELIFRPSHLSSFKAECPSRPLRACSSFLIVATTLLPPLSVSQNVCLNLSPNFFDQPTGISGTCLNISSAFTDGSHVLSFAPDVWLAPIEPTNLSDAPLSAGLQQVPGGGRHALGTGPITAIACVHHPPGRAVQVRW